MHGQIKSGKTIRYKTDSPRHADAIPYKRTKSRWRAWESKED